MTALRATMGRQVADVPTDWGQLAPLLRAAKPGQWVEATAWAVAGGDPDGVVIRLVGGRALYEAAWVVFGRRTDRVRLSRVDVGPHEVARFVDPDARVEVRRAPHMEKR